MIRFLLSAVIAAAIFCDRLQGQQPDVVLTGTFSGADNHAYREILFEVPTGTGRITIEVSYTGRDQRTTIDLGLFRSRALPRLGRAQTRSSDSVGDRRHSLLFAWTDSRRNMEAAARGSEYSC